LGLAQATGETRYSDLALALIRAVHHTLGRHRPDDGRQGWLSGLDELEGEKHPTLGGLRIGKRLPERRRGEPFDQELEWDRDGQYFHYLTKWIHALDQAARAAKAPELNDWARELAEVAIQGFSAGAGRQRGLFWKMSIDLSRPLVPGMGHHDPLDGFVTCLELRATASELEGTAVEPVLDREIEGFQPMIEGADWETEDPLGIGGLLMDAARLGQLIEKGAAGHGDLLNRLLADAVDGLGFYVLNHDLLKPPARRLAFRELGLAIGLAGLPLMTPASPRLIEAVRRYTPLGGEIAAFWSDPAHQCHETWLDHRDINEVMLATSLLPHGFLVLE
jgi:hypothetical protein